MMKKNLTLILAAAAMIAAAVSCQKADTPAEQTENNTILDGVFDISVGASFAVTKALAEDGNNLISTFATSEKIYVYNTTTSTMLTGFLQPDANAAKATLKGTLTGSISTDNSLKLIYLKNAIDYNGQDGTLAGLAGGFDYATATVTVSSVSSGSVTTSNASFAPQQSITKFTFPVNVKSLTISEPEGLVQSVASDGTETKGDITVTLATPSTTVYVALRNNSAAKQTYIFDVTDDAGKTYQGNKSANLQAAKNYATSITNLHEYVDMGFGVKFATCNLGASSPIEVGDYYAWGETEPYYEDGYAKESPGAHWKAGKTGYNWTSYKFNPSGDGATFTKYDGFYVLEMSDDAVRVNPDWGGKWAIPNSQDLEALCKEANSTITYVEDYNGTGVKGHLFTSKISGYEGKSIFFPFTGNRFGEYYYNDNTFYWCARTGWGGSDKTGSDNPNKHLAYRMTTTGNPYNTVTVGLERRFCGFAIRPVISPNRI